MSSLLRAHTHASELSAASRHSVCDCMSHSLAIVDSFDDSIECRVLHAFSSANPLLASVYVSYEASPLSVISFHVTSSFPSSVAFAPSHASVH